MNTQPQKKVAIITGSSRGIGRAIALRLGRDGFSIVLNYISSQKAASETAAAIESQGGSAVVIKADIADPQQVEGLFIEAEKQLGGVDVLVNNAGAIDSNNRPIADTDDALFDRIFATNMKGSFVAMRESARHVRNGGRVINISSTLVAMNLPGYGIYTATKAAIESLTQVFAKELRGRNITVNAVAPGPTATDMFLEGKSNEVIDGYAKAAPLERLGSPEEIAKVVAFLVSPAGGWVNGQTIRANGGLA